MKNIIQTIFKKLKKRKTGTGIFVVSLIILNILLIAYNAELKQNENLLQLYFLNVGQGDSELVILPGGAKILIDAGPPNQKIFQELSKILSPFDRTIDLVSYSHAQQDHMGSLPEVIERYKTSALISNGVGNTIGAYKALKENVKKQNLQNIILSRGDKIRYRSSVIRVLSPAQCLDTKCPNIDLNETSLVLLLESASTTALFTGDIGKKTERALLPELARLASRAKRVEGLHYNQIDVLKVPHHGSKYSSSKEFLQATNPKIAVIEVGKNSYGHPAKATLEQLQHYNTRIFRTDQDGTVKVTSDGKSLRISRIK
ncbi:MAG: MBL fold metallo-hydrolase [bacterium]|nr:MBL fold metallo-hydrolase [bacterium]